jgi:hypothetical protein
VIAESPGTFAELGAFAISKHLRANLLPIADKSFKDDDSFLKVGPIRWVDQESAFRPTIWADLQFLLGSADEIKRRLELGIQNPSPGDLRKVDIARSRQHLLFLVVLFVEIFGPISTEHLAQLIKDTTGPVSFYDIRSLLGLAQALRITEVAKFDGQPLHFRWRPGGPLGPMKRMNPFKISSMRSQVLSVMQTIPSATRALDSLVFPSAA